MNLRRMVIALAALIFVSAPLLANGWRTPVVVASPSHVKPQYGGDFRVSVPVDAGTLDPRLAQDTTAQAIDSLIFDGLDQINNNLSPSHDLATKWKRVNSTTWLFYLRKGVKFSNGHPFTSSDVAYTYRSEVTPALHAPYAQQYTPIKQVVTKGKYEIEFKLSYPYAPLFSYLNLGIVPTTAANDPNFAANPIGTGPFVLRSHTRNSTITLARNSRYFGPKPYVNTITFYIFADTTASVNALKGKTLDLITSPLPPQDVASLKQDSAVKVHQELGDGITYLNVNLQDPILKQLPVREALNLLLDRKGIAQQFTKGVDKPSTTTLIPGTWSYDPSLTLPSFNPTKAAQLLAAAGWKKDSSGILAKNGKELDLTLATYNDPTRVQILTYYQNVLAQVGIKAQVTQADFATFIAQVQAHKYQIALIGWLNLVDPDHGMFEQFTTGGGTNWESYSNKTVDHLLLASRQSSAHSKRKADYVKAWKILLHDLPYIVITAQGWVEIAQKNVEGLVVNRTGSMKPLATVWLKH